MYTIFVNDHPLILISVIPSPSQRLTIFPLKNINLQQVLEKLSKGQLKNACVYHSKADQLLVRFKEKIKTVKAAGGVVKNPNGEMLFIYRNKKWDLPKGKREKGESIQNTAIREVKEETGIQELTLGKFLMETYHIFYRRGCYQLKETHWYHMTSNDITSQYLTPQIEEGITDVSWQPKSQWEALLKKSYPNIQHLLKPFLHKQQP